MATTRLGVSGFARPPYGSFAGKTESAGQPAVVLGMVQHMGSLLDTVVRNTTKRSVTLRIIDSTAGTPETGVVFNTAGIDLWYRREGEAKVSITEADLASPALTDVHADGGFLHIGDGEYRLDLPDAAVLPGVTHVDVGGTVTGMIVLGGRVALLEGHRVRTN